MAGLVDYWTLDVPWQETPMWLRWFGKPKYRAHDRGDIGGVGSRWLYSDTFPSYGGIDRNSVSFWVTTPYTQPDPEPSVSTPKEN